MRCKGVPRAKECFDGNNAHPTCLLFYNGLALTSLFIEHQVQKDLCAKGLHACYLLFKSMTLSFEFMSTLLDLLGKLSCHLFGTLKFSTSFGGFLDLWMCKCCKRTRSDAWVSSTLRMALLSSTIGLRCKRVKDNGIFCSLGSIQIRVLSSCGMAWKPSYAPTGFLFTRIDITWPSFTQIIWNKFCWEDESTVLSLMKFYNNSLQSLKFVSSQN